MSKMKFSTPLYNRRTGEEVFIEAATEESLQKKVDNQIAKWDKELQTEDGHLEEKELNSQLEDMYRYMRSIPYVRLSPITPDRYIRQRLDDIHRPWRTKPDLKEYQKELGPNIFMKAGALLSDSLKEKSERLQKEARERYDKDLKEYEDRVARDDEEYNEDIKRKRALYSSQMEKLPSGDKSSVRAYFSYVLNADAFSIDGGERYRHAKINADYYRKVKTLVYAVQIPDAEEIPVIYRYQYNEKKNTMETLEYNTKDAQELRIRVAEAVLLRKAALVFLSDTCGLIDRITMSGYLTYYDPALGKDRKRFAIRLDMTKKDFEKISLEDTDPYMLFGRTLGAKVTPGLYTKEPYELNDVNPYE